MIDKGKLIEALQARISPKQWKSFWLNAPTAAVFLLPFGILVTKILALIGFAGVGRLTQLLILFSVIYGFFIGTTILFLADGLGFGFEFTNKIRWLGRFAFVSPLLTILVLFLVFSH